MILDWQPELDALSHKHKLPRAKLEKAFDIHQKPSLRGTLDINEFWKRLKKDLAITSEENFDFTLFSMQQFKPIHLTHAFVKKLFKTIPVGLLTNISPGYFELSLTHGHIPDINYHAVIQSCDIGFIKPEKEIYLYAQEKAGVDPHEILFTDDVEENVEAAKSLGWQGVVFDTANPQLSINKLTKIIGLT